MKYTFGPLLLCVFLLGLPNLGYAATLYLDPGVATLYRGDAIKVAIRLNVNQSEGECINVVDGVLTYTDNIQPVDVSVGSSIFSLWIEPPTINRDDRTITFAGGIPNGYCGRVQGDPRITNTIAEVVFRSPGMVVGAASDSNEVFIEFSPETRALLNDGFGTNAPLTTIGSRLQLERSPGSELSDPWRQAVTEDTLAPEEFSITLVQDELIHNRRYYIVFNTSDKQTGIAEYLVMEEPLEDFWAFRWGGADVPWVPPTGPNYHVLSDQTLNSIIRVKAIDKAGNEYVATLVPDEALRTMSLQRLTTMLFIGFGILVMIVIGGVGWWFLRRRRSNGQTKIPVVSDQVVVQSDDDSDNYHRT